MGARGFAEKCLEALSDFGRLLPILAFFGRCLPNLAFSAQNNAFFGCEIWPNTSLEHFSISGQDFSSQKELLWKVLGSTMVRKRIYAKSPVQRCGRHPRRSSFRPCYGRLEILAISLGT